MNITPWNLDAYRTFIGGATEDQLLVNRPIREFLDYEDKFLLVGAKGLGKTLFLRYKSYLFHTRYGDAMQFNESNTELTENLNIQPNTFSKEELLQYQDVEIWQLVWQLALWIMIFRIRKLPINGKLEKIVDKAEQLSTILTRLLNHRKKIESYREYLMEFQEQKRKIQNGVAVFIDDVDQALHNCLIMPHHSDEYFEGTESPSVAVWVNAQIGLIGAIYNLNRQNGHIKIYATIRREAFEAWDSELKINYMHHVSMLQYNKDEIASIFEKNIQIIEQSDFILKTSNASLVARFIGFDAMEHRFAEDADGQKRQEKIFDFMYRHTYGRPREIVLMGKKINDLIVTDAYKYGDAQTRINKLRILVNEVGYELFRQYKKEIIPYFNEERLSQFLEQVRSNVITKDDRHFLNPDTVREYFNIGLLGYARAVNHDNQMKQIFNPPAIYNYRSNHPIPDAAFLLIHSTMDTLLLDKHMYGNFYNQYNIIGDGYVFYPRVNNYIRKPEYYLPLTLSGNRMASANEGAGHDFPLQEIYRHFFNFGEYPQHFDKLMFNWNIAKLVLGLLGRVCYCHRLDKVFNHELFHAKHREYLYELGKHPIARRYNAALKDKKSPNAIECFLDKLVGRYLTLVCYLVLDLRIEWIHQLLTNGKFDFLPDLERKDTAYSYLSRSFFIAEFRRDEPRDPDSPEHRARKQKIFLQLSPFEQESIRSFIETASDEVSYLDWIDDPEHKDWLLKNVVSRLWRPEK